MNNIKAMSYAKDSEYKNKEKHYEGYLKNHKDVIDSLFKIILEIASDDVFDQVVRTYTSISRLKLNVALDLADKLGWNEYNNWKVSKKTLSNLEDICRR